MLVAAGSGLLGFVMIKLDYSRPALLLGLVLGEMFESNLFLSLILHGTLFFMTPISLGIIGIIVLLFAYPALKRLITHVRR